MIAQHKDWSIFEQSLSSLEALPEHGMSSHTTSRSAEVYFLLWEFSLCTGHSVVGFRLQLLVQALELCQ
jgi:hypothetical protein